MMIMMTITTMMITIIIIKMRRKRAKKNRRRGSRVVGVGGKRGYRAGDDAEEHVGIGKVRRADL